MNDLECAKALLDNGSYTCVLASGESVLTSEETGIKPMLGFIASGVKLGGYCAADKIVGRAAAMLFIYAGITSVYGEVMSKGALDLLRRAGITAECGTLTAEIIRRDGNGKCPMELAVTGIDDPEEAYIAIKNELERLKRKNKMKKLGFGFMRLPILNPADDKTFDKEQICRMVDEFLEKGFTYFDTAYMYHGGKSEIMLREALVERHPRESFLVASKLPTMFLKEEADVERIFNEQLEKCGVSYFDYYLLHCLNVENYEIATRLHAFEFAVKMKAEGKIKRLGFSYHDNAKLLDEILTAHPETEFVQLQLNYLDWEDSNVQSRLCYEVARKHGKDIIVMEPVKGGTLAKLPPEAQKLLRAKEPQLSDASWAIRFAATHEGVIMVLSGMSSLEQLRDNLSYMADFKPLNADEIALTEMAADIINARIAIPCTACRYCVDGCPMKIAIPEYFSLYNAEMREVEKAFTVQGALYENLTAAHGKASDCIGCGQCESHCPQHIGIIEQLKRVAKVFE